MHTIFRLEFPNGNGVYCASDPIYYDMLQDHQHDPIDHPKPADDGLQQAIVDNMHFGFQSLDSMRAWFCGAERLYLSTFGIMLACYSARGPIVTGKKQVAFYRQAAELLWQRPLNHF